MVTAFITLNIGKYIRYPLKCEGLQLPFLTAEGYKKRINHPHDFSF